MRDAAAWASRTFGNAKLGNTLRTQRLVAVAEQAAKRPSGVVSQACASSASKEGAFRLLENGKVRPDAVATAVHECTVRDCRRDAIVFVPVDGSELTIADAAGAKGLGGVGAWNKGARGVQTMNALAVGADGTPVGLCAQRMWIRTERSKAGPHEGPSKRSESRFWHEILEEVHATFAEHAPETRPWFQMDRGADAWPLLQLATNLDALVTVRAVYDRTLESGARLWSTLQRAPIRAKRSLNVPARPPRRRKKRVRGKRITYLTRPRRARTAKLTIRAATVAIARSSKRKETVAINAVFASENRRGEDRIVWMLLTTHPIRTKRDVLAVVDGYAMRWRVEDFHRAWKGGLCRVEDMQLRSRDAIFKWATILAAVATRATRLTHLARETPNALATTEFSFVELQALLALRQPKGFDEGVIPTLTLHQAVRWVADVGGYSGPWNGPPGATVIGRGLYDVLVTARAFAYRDKTR
jgi:hypothetical protein